MNGKTGLSLFATAIAASLGACGAPSSGAEHPAGPSSAGPGPAAQPPTSERPCGELTPRECGEAHPRCVFRPGEACREPRNECEAIRPDPSWQGQPVFERGDPCENVRPGCAWDPRAEACAPFVAVTECPESRAAAQVATVLCHHSAQAQLSCVYGDVHCACERPSRCGGAPPPPPRDPPPLTFACTPPFDERGCPTGQVRDGSPCDLDETVRCAECTTLVQCVRGHWRVSAIPGPP
jgi:hypothetical protein